jgi:hypothetical protein
MRPRRGYVASGRGFRHVRHDVSKALRELQELFRPPNESGCLREQAAEKKTNETDCEKDSTATPSLPQRRDQRGPHGSA